MTSPYKVLHKIITPRKQYHDPIIQEYQQGCFDCFKVGNGFQGLIGYHNLTGWQLKGLYL
jgi:hypothetical protein